MAVDGIGSPGGAPAPSTQTANRASRQTTPQQTGAGTGARASTAARQTPATPAVGSAGNLPGLATAGDGLIDGVAPPRGTYVDGTVNLMAAGERLSPIAFVKRPLLLPAIPPWLRCEIGEASGGKSSGVGR